ncbi:hypothetical protein [Actinomadura bangladeshensis]|uniref:Uncharacterized protein n=1 Tax=Actinomadura bangladeshensis TaxID=453573 RepID=A0A6L9QGG1_9ACTN|nr:hypothetical protein [Actinomadura bangladeshensis]NEA24569.1 hypothetical protein [Actinomadura bangladeshensis]
MERPDVFFDKRPVGVQVRFYVIIRSVKTKVPLSCALLALLLAACGPTETPDAKPVATQTASQPSEDQMIVSRNVKNGHTNTYAEIRDQYAAPDKDMTGIDCAEFLLMVEGLAGGQVEYPNGKGLWIKACEEGVKIHDQNQRKT